MCHEGDAEIYAITKFRKKPTFAKSELITPSPREEHVKRRRLGKQSEDHHLEDYQRLMSDINQLVPRVGKGTVQDANILERLQQLFHDQQIIHVIACRGTDRTMGPPKGMHPEEAPFRKSFLLERGTGTIKYEKDWERWTNLANRQLIRPAHACRINITMFAKPWPTGNYSSQSSRGSNEQRGSRSEPAPPDPESATAAPAQSRASNAEPVTSGPRSEIIPAVQPEVDNGTHHDPSESHQETPNAENRFHEIKPGERSIHQTGPNIRALPKWDQRMIIQMDKNLGPVVTSASGAGYRPEIVHASQELECATCSACAPPKHQRPTILKPIREFNFHIYLDGVKWTNHSGQSFNFYHIIDAGSNFHVAITSPSGETEQVIQLINRHWISCMGWTP